MTSREEAPKVNAGSMADIAFLLLIFFLVTTSIETDAGLDHMLPRETTDTIPPPIPQCNIFLILINGNDELLVDDEFTELKDLREMTIAFLDNGGVDQDELGYCNYC
jgi:biopolymer transport protein TolR